MHKGSPYYLFDPSSPGSIRRRLDRGEYVPPEDVAAALAPESGGAPDPVILNYAARCLRGEVARPKGRPRQSFGRTARLCVAGMLVQEQIAAWRKGIGDDLPRKGRGEKSFSEAACEKFGLPLGLSGRALANAVSALKSNPLFGD